MNSGIPEELPKCPSCGAGTTLAAFRDLYGGTVIRVCPNDHIVVYPLSGFDPYVIDDDKEHSV